MKKVAGIALTLGLFAACTTDPGSGGNYKNEIRIDAFTHSWFRFQREADEVLGDTVVYDDKYRVLIDTTLFKPEPHPAYIIDTIRPFYYRVLYPAKYEPNHFSCHLRRTGYILLRETIYTADSSLPTVMTDTRPTVGWDSVFYQTEEHVMVEDPDWRSWENCSYIPGKGFFVDIPSHVAGTIVIGY